MAKVSSCNKYHCLLIIQLRKQHAGSWKHGILAVGRSLLQHQQPQYYGTYLVQRHASLQVLQIVASVLFFFSMEIRVYWILVYKRLICHLPLKGISFY